MYTPNEGLIQIAFLLIFTQHPSEFFPVHGDPLALIFISSPVCEFLPFRTFLLLSLKVPKPTSVTVSFFFNALVMLSNTQSTAARVIFLVLRTFVT